MTYSNDISEKKALPVSWKYYQHVECPECGGYARTSHRVSAWMWLECENGHCFTGKPLHNHHAPWSPKMPLRDNWYPIHIGFALREMGIDRASIKEVNLLIDKLVGEREDE